MRTRSKIVIVAAVAALAAGLLAPAALAAPRDVVYEVTITNLTDGQPLSPPVVATHRKAVRLFQPGRLASAAIEAIAENGDQSLAVAALSSSRHVTDVVDVGVPLLTRGTAQPFPDTVTFTIEARPGDRISLATMLICTNDGFTGVDSAKLPKTGSATLYLSAYDAGTEGNTQRSEDIVDPCSAVGPVQLDGDPNGNVNFDGPRQHPIEMHPGIHTRGDLSAVHGWSGPIAMVTITRVS